MTEELFTALLTGGITLVGVLTANSRSQAVTDTKLEELTREVREHNHFARRMPLLEEKMEQAERSIGELQALHHRQGERRVNHGRQTSGQA